MKAGGFFWSVTRAGLCNHFFPGVVNKLGLYILDIKIPVLNLVLEYSGTIVYIAVLALEYTSTVVHSAVKF